MNFDNIANKNIDKLKRHINSIKFTINVTLNNFQLN